jgi:toxin ParE1/3/4
MPEPRILRSELAKRDLLEIWSYVSRESSPQIADAVLARLYGAMDVLAAAPLIGRARTEFRGRPRSFAVRPYVVFYEPLADDNGIAIWRILHGARRLDRLVRRPRKVD